MQFDKILFPVDLSEQCRRVAPFVKDVALRFNSQVLMLHVMQSPPMYGAPPDLGFAPIIDLDLWRKERRASVNTFLTEELAGISLVRVVVEGDPAIEIVNAARKERMDVVMMPTHGHGPFRALLLGSVTAKVLHDVECPVWTASHTEKAPAHPPPQWRRIICAVELIEEDVRPVQWARELAREEGAEFLLLHAIPAFNAEAVWPEKSFRESMSYAAHQQMVSIFGDAVKEAQVSIQFGSPARVVGDAAMAWNADLVVIGRGESQKRLGRLRSDAYGIIRESPCPVISV